MTTKTDAFLAIARCYLNSEIATLSARNSDALDFFDVGVLGIASALEAAYQMGREAAKGEAKATLQKVAAWLDSGENTGTFSRVDADAIRSLVRRASK